MSKEALALKNLRNRIIGFQASVNVYRVIDDEIRRYDPHWQGDFSWQRKKTVVDRNEKIQRLERALERSREALKQYSHELCHGYSAREALAEIEAILKGEGR